MIVALARSLETRIIAATALGVLCCLALAACDAEPLFDASSVPAYQKSLGTINARLSESGRNRLKIALRTLALGGPAEFAVRGQARIPANIEALESVTDPTALLDRMRPKIEGKTAAAVIGVVVADIDAEIARTESQLGSVDTTPLSKIVIENERYVWEQIGLFDHATIQFSVYNGGAKAITRLYLDGVVTTRSRATPLTTGALVYGFFPALQPGRQQQAKIFVTRGELADTDLEQVYDAGLTLKLTNADDSSGRKLLVFKSDNIEAMRLERLVLAGS
jgi:hypothetical protein